MLKKTKPKGQNDEINQTSVDPDIQLYVQQQIQDRMDQFLKTINPSLAVESIRKLTSDGELTNIFRGRGPRKVNKKTKLRISHKNLGQSVNALCNQQSTSNALTIEEFDPKYDLIMEEIDRRERRSVRKQQFLIENLNAPYSHPVDESSPMSIIDEHVSPLQFDVSQQCKHYTQWLCPNNSYGNELSSCKECSGSKIIICTECSNPIPQVTLCGQSLCGKNSVICSSFSHRKEYPSDNKVFLYTGSLHPLPHVTSCSQLLEEDKIVGCPKCVDDKQIYHAYPERSIYARSASGAQLLKPTVSLDGTVFNENEDNVDDESIVRSQYDTTDVVETVQICDPDVGHLECFRELIKNEISEYKRKKNLEDQYWEDQYFFFSDYAVSTEFQLSPIESGAFKGRGPSFLCKDEGSAVLAMLEVNSQLNIWFKNRDDNRVLQDFSNLLKDLSEKKIVSDNTLKSAMDSVHQNSSESKKSSPKLYPGALRANSYCHGRELSSFKDSVAKNRRESPDLSVIIRQ